METLRKRNRHFINAIALILVATMAINMTACTSFTMRVQAEDLMDGVASKTVQGKTVDEKFISNTADFSIELFKKSITNSKNSLVSPLSVMLALAMTANGAGKETLLQMQKVLGKDIPLDVLNEYLFTYVKDLPNENKSKLTIANSIWFRDEENRLTVEKDFLQKNADYYKAAAYKSAFDDQTLKDINNWVKSNTDGMIDKILDQISGDAVMYLINAIVFDARWETVYKKNDIYDGDFTSIDGNKQNVDFMSSEESIYLDDGKATGFIKPYANDKYSFVALLPNIDIPIADYIASLTGENFLNLINDSDNTPIGATLPKFSYEYSIHMNDALKELGMPDAFSGSADFNKLGKSTRGNIFIGDVLHKTFIAVDELGTKAGAVTKVEMQDKSAMESKSVRLDRPFVYAIIDNATDLPVFIGTVMSVKG
ncbi:MAG: serpin family protein [Eubacteriales bacterium]